jgi:hypothetical protein
MKTYPEKTVFAVLFVVLMLAAWLYLIPLIRSIH